MLPASNTVAVTTSPATSAPTPATAVPAPATTAPAPAPSASGTTISSFVASPSSVAPGATFTVHWSVINPTADNWIGLYPVSPVASSSTPAIAWTYTAGWSSWTTTAPSRAGQYQFRYFDSNSYTQVQPASNTVTVAAAIVSSSASLSTRSSLD